MRELKIWDKVEIYDDISKEWQERIFIKFGINDGVICFDRYYEDEFYRGGNFTTYYWEKDKWRLIAENKYRPFNEKDDWVNALKGRWIKHKEGQNVIAEIYQINIAEKRVFFELYNGWATLEDLYNNYLFDDGTIIGVCEVKK
jgi:hypothetical protein